MRPRGRGALLGLLLWWGSAGLGGCATPAPPAVPAEITVPVAAEAALEASLALLMERGYVIRHADADLGRLDAVLARWPGYRVQVESQAAGEGARVAMTAHRGGRPLPPTVLDPLLVDLQSRLGLLP